MKRFLPMWAFFAVIVSACGGAAAQAKSEPCCDDKPAAATTPTPGLPESAVCPVMGEKFVPDANTKTAQYKGKTVYFCCPGCDAKFAADPSKYEKNITE